MEHREQVYAIENHFISGEKNPSEFKTGVEMEHFIIDADSLESISYSGECGVERILKEMTYCGWEIQNKGEHILELRKNEAGISVEPAGQIELDIMPQKCLGYIENIYLSFLKDIAPILKKTGKMLISVGYHPKSSIHDVELIPKQRYRYMYEYFATKGRYAHNMMKGTASTQVCMDYSSEEDYIKKFTVASFLSPIVYFMFDNAPFFEGDVYKNFSARKMIWNQCDRDRCGLLEEAFENNYSYSSYARYILERPPVLTKRNSKLSFTGNLPLKTIFNPLLFNEDEIEHLLSMYFFDIRTRKYIEIRMGDSLPYPYNMGYFAFWKGLLYNCRNLNFLFETALDFDNKRMERLKEDIIEKGFYAHIQDAYLINFIKEIVYMSKKGLQTCEKGFLSIIECMIEKELRPKDITLENINKGKKAALKWCSPGEMIFTGRCNNIACC